MARLASFSKVMGQLNKCASRAARSKSRQGRLPNWVAMLSLMRPGTATTTSVILVRYLTEKGMRAVSRSAKKSDWRSGVLKRRFLTMRPCLVHAAMRVLVPPISIVRYIY